MRIIKNKILILTLLEIPISTNSSAFSGLNSIRGLLGATRGNDSLNRFSSYITQQNLSSGMQCVMAGLIFDLNKH